MSDQRNDLAIFKEQLKNYLSAIDNTRQQYLHALAEKNMALHVEAKEQNKQPTPSKNSTQVWSDVAVLDLYHEECSQVQAIITLLDTPSQQAIWPGLTRFLGKSTYQAILDDLVIQGILKENSFSIDHKIDSIKARFGDVEIQAELKRIQNQQTRDIAILTMALFASAAGLITGVVLLHHLAVVIFAIVALASLFVMMATSLSALTFKKNLKQEVKDLAEALGTNKNENFTLSKRTHSYKIDDEITVKTTAPSNVPTTFKRKDLHQRLTATRQCFFETSDQNTIKDGETLHTTNTVKEDVENEYKNRQPAKI